MLRLQVLIATMNQSDFSIYKKMNLQTDALFANQSDCFEYKSTLINNHSVEMFNTKTKGVGKNRNIAFTFSNGDILLIADDDLVYDEGYEKIITDAFCELEDADAIIFNVDTIGYNPGRRKINKINRVKLYNALNYGAVRIAVKRNSLLREGITFNENFGGGTIYSAGEDSLFIRDLIKNNLVVYTYPERIAVVTQYESSWFSGYNKKYFFDKGALFFALSKHFYKILLIQDLIRHWNIYFESGFSKKEVLRIELKGANSYKKLVPYKDYKF